MPTTVHTVMDIAYNLKCYLPSWPYVIQNFSFKKFYLSQISDSHEETGLL